MNGSEVEGRYIIRVGEEEDLMRINRMGELENILRKDDRAQLEHLIEPIGAAIAFIYDENLVRDLEAAGYEMLPQRKVKMIEENERGNFTG